MLKILGPVMACAFTLIPLTAHADQEPEKQQQQQQQQQQGVVKTLIKIADVFIPGDIEELVEELQQEQQQQGGKKR